MAISASSARAINSSQSISIAHTADGNNFRSTFLLNNSGTLDAPYTLSIFGATGQPETFGFDVPNALTGTVSTETSKNPAISGCVH